MPGPVTQPMQGQVYECQNTSLNVVTHLGINQSTFNVGRTNCLGGADCMGKHSQYQCARE